MRETGRFYVKDLPKEREGTEKTRREKERESVKEKINRVDFKARGREVRKKLGMTIAGFACLLADPKVS